MANPPPISIWDHLISILQLPFVVLVILPAGIYLLTQPMQQLGLYLLSPVFSISLGFLFLGIGASLFVSSLRLFVKIGKGTLAPWNPTRKLVVRGLYRYVRNPMILGVNCLLLSESFFLKSENILMWMLFFLLLNHFYFIFKEEPDMRRRFGPPYEEYCRNVPRWIPRITPWRQPDQNLG